MKRVFSVVFCIVILLTSASAVDFSAQAASSPFYYETTQQGSLLTSITASFTKRRGVSISQTKKKGKKLQFSRYRKLTVLGQEKKNGSYFYIQIYKDDEPYYGYVKRHNIVIKNTQNFETFYVEKNHPYYKTRLLYKYFMYEGMPFYQFNQTGKSGKWINGLKVSYSCGPHSVAAVLSALNGDIIYPETIMHHMSGGSVAAGGNATRLTNVVSSVKPYIKSKYNLNYEYKNIKPSEAFKYVKNGYLVILGVENDDRLTIFTGLNHYIVLVGYDSTGNLMTVNSNLKTGLFDSFATSRIKRNVHFNSEYYKRNTVAFKYKYNDYYYGFEDELKCKALEKSEMSTHYNGYGKLTRIPNDADITILGERDSRYYVKYKDNYGFLPKEKTSAYVRVSLSNSEYTYSASSQAPNVTVKDYKGNPISSEEYHLTYPKESVNPGKYKIDIEYSGKHLGPSSIEYTILPPKAKIHSIKAKGKNVTVKWNDIPNDWSYTKFQIEYSTDKNFKKNVKTVTVDKDKLSKKIKVRQENTKYYFRIRTYKYTADEEKLYSHYSAKKTIKIKK